MYRTLKRGLTAFSITRGLKLGLTAITILTAGGFAGTAFAEVQIIDDFVERCSGTSTETGCTTAVKLCITNPFGAGCAATFGGDDETIVINNDLTLKVKNAHAVAKVRHCANQPLPSDSDLATHVCRDIWGGANAANWVKKNPTALDVPTGRRGRWGRFLKGTADGLNEGEARNIQHQGSLNLKTATFNGVALGGDATDGVAFFWGEYRPFSGIFSGTDLGAPVTELSGTASWVGRWQYGDETSAKDFVLEVDFDNQTVDAFVKLRDPSPWSFYLAGNYDDSGIITGNFEVGPYENKERRIVTANYGNSAFFNGTFRGTKYGTHVKGVVTGLIGQDGAVGAFTARGVDLQGTGSYTYAGGFVARPAGLVTGAQTFLDDTCNSTNPFATASRNQEFCYIEYAKDRVAIIDDCIKDDGSVKISSDCTTAAGQYSCINNPFTSECATDPDFKDIHVIVRANRLNFCNIATNSRNSLCTPTEVVDAVCENNFFGNGCVKSLGYDARLTERISFCNMEANLRHRDCTPTEVVDAVCEANPFGLGCLNHTADVIKYNTARLKRAKFCNRNMSDDLCRGQGVTTANICSQLPFDSICNTGYDDQRLARAKRCVNNNGVDPLCRGIVTTANICSQLPFDSTCDSTRFEYRRTERITFCNDEVTPRNNPRCTPTEVVTAVCDDNLFGTGCLRYSNDNSVYNNKRTVRITTCNNGGSQNKHLDCTPTDVVAAICADNLFGTGCFNSADPDGSYADARTRSLDVCNIATNSYSSLCRDANLDNICSYAPFLAVCLGHADSNFKRTSESFTTCRGADPSDLTCTGVTRAQELSGKADAATWADGLITLANPKRISSIRSVNLYDVQYTRSQFLEGLEKDFDFPHLPTRGKTPFTTLTLADNLVNSTIPVGGDSEDGVAFFGLKAKDYGHIAFPFYAGILSSTDLGAPVTGISGTVAVWSGVFQAIGGYGRAIKRNFDLTINFTDSKTGTIDAFVNSTGNNYYHLSGNFDSIGVITGTVDYGSFMDGNRDASPTDPRFSGRLTGLIGEQGAVGAFIADMDGPNGFYSGGFVAREIVDYVNWEAEANPLDELPATTGNHKFVSGELLDSASETEKLNLRTATYNGYLLNGDSADGVAFFKRPADAFPASYYAGVFSGTDLGAPVAQTGKSAYWSGSLKVVTVRGEQPAVDFVLTVNFVGAADRAGSIVAEALNAADSNGPQSMHLNGKFDYKGVITGTSQMGNSSFGAGNLIGLIGQDGAVGTFISTAGVEYSGGFVARPHSVNIKDLRNYATLETTPSRGLNSGSEFLSATLSNGELDRNDRHFPSGFNFIENTRNIIGRRDGDTDDGYQYFGIEHDDQDSRYYAGILSTTNLGAPLVTPAKDAPITTAIWEGDVRYTHLRTPDHDTKPTKFYVNFSAGTIGFANDAENGTDTATVIEGSDHSTGVQLTLEGKFGPGDSSLGLGQLGGHMLVSNRPDTQLFPVTGLIGQDGVVGVFVNPSNTSGAAGGFTASPQ